MRRMRVAEESVFVAHGKIGFGPLTPIGFGARITVVHIRNYGEVKLPRAA